MAAPAAAPPPAAAPAHGRGAPKASIGRRLGGAEAALTFTVIAVVALLVVPLPTFLLDLLLATNLSLSVAVLLVVLYVPDALGIATFPTLLLVTTLFRLALNVSSSRLILLQADAGEVIRSFGQFVVRGNYVVGGVIFLILTVIQFIVIAKGSERVAEVGARFTLDAMPGKQMAIDAELRSGAIDGNEARKRRRQLSRESQFYGAMDGAMKFVKGDVIASLIITAVNLLGGLAIGVLQRGMGAEAALKRYGLLTIGDGLVTQIPALVLSTAAGLLVTRVASEEPDTSLGAELGAQLFGAPRALAMASFFVALLAVVPGLPTLPFLAIAALFFVGSRARQAALEIERVERGAEAAPPPPPRPQRKPPAFVPVVAPWIVEISSDLEPLVDDEVRGDEVARVGLQTALAGLRERLFQELGVPLPAPKLRLVAGMPARHVVLLLHEIPAAVLSPPRELPDARLAEACADQIYAVLRRRAADFMGLHEAQTLVDQLEQVAPAVVRQVMPKPVTLSLLADVLRRLVEEGVSVRDLRAIFEALAAFAPSEKDPLQLTELARAQMRRALTFRLTGGAGDLDVYLLDPAIEDVVRQSITRTSAGSFLTLAPAAARDVVRSLKRAVESAPPPPGRRAVLLTQPDVRRFVRKLVESDLPELEVVSFAELLPEVSLRPLAKASMAD
ncbi:MAG TPA: flagellar biosynthesis protein FlhA [Polyangiaceae bacterium]|nr:flagellar biosynthesis protein FlhA [Polyangiaceae bacterium]